MDSTFINNQARGGFGGFFSPITNDLGNGGNGMGGAIAVTGGNVSLVNDTIELNGATGGEGGSSNGPGGGAFGGGLFVSGGSVTLSHDTVDLNTAVGGRSNQFQGARSTAAAGGGIYQGGGTVSLDAFTLAHVINNTDSNDDGFNNTFP
jgi:hypothetical protein